MTTSEEQKFMQRWWPRGDAPPCPHCGEKHLLLRLNTRARFKCLGCSRQVSLTTGTPFFGSKLPFAMINRMVALFDRGASPYAVCQKMGVQYVTAHRYAKLLAQGMSARESQDPQGLGPKAASPVAKPCAPTLVANPSPHRMNGEG